MHAAPTTTPLRTAALLPDTLGNAPNQRNLCPLFVLGQLVADLAAGKATLGRQVQVLERHVLCGFADALDDNILVLKLSDLGGYMPSTTFLPGATYLSGSKPPARGVSNSR